MGIRGALGEGGTAFLCITQRNGSLALDRSLPIRSADLRSFPNAGSSSAPSPGSIAADGLHSPGLTCMRACTSPRAGVASTIEIATNMRSHSTRCTAGCHTFHDFVHWRFSDAGQLSLPSVSSLPASKNQHRKRQSSPSRRVTPFPCNLDRARLVEPARRITNATARLHLPGSARRLGRLRRGRSSPIRRGALACLWDFPNKTPKQNAGWPPSSGN
jgi:hypothetical protein